MKIAKEFRWEMGHRLPFHKGLCRNVHGHSYKMVVEITGEVNKKGMIIDFYDLGKIAKPIISKYDHAFLCWENDKPLKRFLIQNNMKRVIVNYHSTVENICSDFLKNIYSKIKKIKGNNLRQLSVKIFETPNSFAEKTIEF
ncbi:MAG: 6-pyruvoyl trahydropterin synthase family protein [Ignavibacteria bacterium]